MKNPSFLFVLLLVLVLLLDFAGDFEDEDEDEDEEDCASGYFSHRLQNAALRCETVSGCSRFVPVRSVGARKA